MMYSIPRLGRVSGLREEGRLHDMPKLTKEESEVYVLVRALDLREGHVFMEGVCHYLVTKDVEPNRFGGRYVMLHLLDEAHRQRLLRKLGESKVAVTKASAANVAGR